MFCIKCGNQLPDGSHSCSRCGAEQRFGEQVSGMGLTGAFDRYRKDSQTLRPADLIGQTIDGKYRLDAELGVGGMGAVYRATRLLIGDTVAVKFILPEYVSDAMAVQRFQREAQATALLKHPNAVPIYDFGTTREGLVYLVMELVDGHSLRRIIKQGPLSPLAASIIINQVCAALDEAHRRNIIHRDLKPDNIIVTTTSSGPLVKVVDFGLAKLLDPNMTKANLTQTGSVMGTPHYMSPEQLLGDEIDSRSDIYSLGVILYEMLTGRVPFNSPTPTAIVVQHVNQPPPSLRLLDASIPPSVEAVVLHALEKRREARPRTAGALAQELSAAARGEAAPSPPPPQPIQMAETLSGPVSDPWPVRATMPTMSLNTPPTGRSVFTPSNPSVAPYSSQASSAGTGRKLLPLVVVLVLALGLVGGALALWLQYESDDTQTGQPNGNSKGKGNDGSQATSQTTQPTNQPPKTESGAPRSAEDEIKALRERRMNATQSDYAQLTEDLKAAENRYPNDYRFTYERAKLYVTGTTSHPQPFQLLYAAGRKAIANGKSNEMLAELERDGSADLKKLAKGHPQWGTLQDALRNNNKDALVDSP